MVTTRKDLASAGTLDRNIVGVVKISKKRKFLPANVRDFAPVGTWYKMTKAAPGDVIVLERQSDGGEFKKGRNVDGSYMRCLTHHGSSGSYTNVLSLPTEYADAFLDKDDTCYVTILDLGGGNRALRRSTKEETENYACKKKIHAVSGVIARSSQNRIGTVYLTEEERDILDVKSGNKIVVCANMTERASISFRKFDPAKDSSCGILSIGVRERDFAGAHDIVFVNRFENNNVRIPTFFMRHFDLQPGQQLRTFHTKDTLVFGVAAVCDVCGRKISTSNECFVTRHVCMDCANAGMAEFVKDNGGTLVAAAAVL